MSRSPKAGECKELPELPGFAHMLDQHLANGSRSGRRGEPWTRKEFAAVIGEEYDTVSRWISGKRRPHTLKKIELGLFGPGPLDDEARQARQQLRQAHREARASTHLPSGWKDVLREKINPIVKISLKQQLVGWEENINAIVKKSIRRQLEDIKKAMWSTGIDMVTNLSALATSGAMLALTAGRNGQVRTH